MRYLPDPFVLALLGAILVAWIWPGPGAVQGLWTLHTAASIGISVIFFMYGLSLSFDKIKNGITHWQLNLLIHFGTFVIFPLLVLAAWRLGRPFYDGELWVGVLFLAALPSTVTSSVVMVSIARGNVPSAIFNTSISGLLGIFITPLWMSLVLAHSDHVGLDLLHITGQLMLKTLLPVIMGASLNPWLDGFVRRNKANLMRFDQAIVILIVYTTFCGSFAAGFADDFQWTMLLALAVGLIALFFTVFGLIRLLCGLLGFSREDRITAVFCGSKKSLAHGVAMSKVLFASHQTLAASLGLVLLPIMTYHAMQLVIASAIARKYDATYKEPQMGRP